MLEQKHFTEWLAEADCCTQAKRYTDWLEHTGDTPKERTPVLCRLNTIQSVLRQGFYYTLATLPEEDLDAYQLVRPSREEGHRHYARLLVDFLSRTCPMEQENLAGALSKHLALLEKVDFDRFKRRDFLNLRKFKIYIGNTLGGYPRYRRDLHDIFNAISIRLSLDDYTCLKAAPHLSETPAFRHLFETPMSLTSWDGSR